MTKFEANHVQIEPTSIVLALVRFMNPHSLKSALRNIWITFDAFWESFCMILA